MKMSNNFPRWLFVLIGLVIVVVVIAVVLYSINTMGKAAIHTPVSPHSTTTPSRSSSIKKMSDKHVFLIVMENHNWSDIKNNSSAPYINHTLLPMASYAEQYYNPPGNHPSEPNYLWLEAGTNFGISNDADPVFNHQSTSQHLVTLLSSAGISWKSYQEGISGTECPLIGSGRYAPKHNPMVFFDDVTNSNDPNSSNCISHVRPYTELATDLQRNTEANYNFITPNLCDDMHDSCAPLNDPVKQGDSWLAQNLPTILNSQAYKNGGVIFITWDEGEGRDGPIGMIVLSNNAKGGGYLNTIHYTHSSTLRTLEEIFGVTPFLGDAANATDLSDLFKTL
jgi:phosphatidylinositol-3-phosphatase